MILKGSQRAGATELAAHLLNRKDNEHVRVHELRGFVADDLHGALREAQAIARGTRCTQFMFSLSLNPPKDGRASEADFTRAADRAEKALGLDGQPRAIVFHEKEGRRHAHVVWSRIDASQMRAVNLPHFKQKLTALSRELYLEHGWKLPDGLRPDGGKNPLNFTLAQWQQAKRLGRDPREIKADFRDAWNKSDSAKALAAALAERGYFLAKGDRRGFVAVDTDGKEYAFAKWASVKTRDVEARFGPPDALPPVAQVSAEVARLMSRQMRGFIADVRARHATETGALRESVSRMTAAHRGERALLTKRQEERWAEETQARAERLRSGLRGLWDALTGRARTLRERNELEAFEGLRRDRAQRDALSEAQRAERAPLQNQIEALRTRHAQERRILAGEITRHLRRRSRAEEPAPDPAPKPRRRRGFSLEH